MSTQESARFLPGRQWVSVAVVLGCVLLLIGLVLPAIHNAREAARRTQSKNNLKQLGLAFHNYHDVYRVFPLGADVLADGTANHGWSTRIIPYLEQSITYSQINFNVPWNHSINELPFRQSPLSMTNPAVVHHFSSDGFGLLHYMSNPNVTHRNHCVSIDDMTTGTANNWLMGEAAGNYQPWGYPFNWRPLDLPLNGDPGSYGVWPNGGLFCLADGSVVLLRTGTDASIVTTLKDAAPVASAEQIAVPEHRFETSSDPLRQETFWPDVPDYASKGDGVGTTLLYDRSDKPYFANVYRSDGKPVWNVEHTMRIDLIGVLENYPEVRILSVPLLDDENAEIVAQFPNLEVVQAWNNHLTEKGLAILESHPRHPSVLSR